MPSGWMLQPLDGSRPLSVSRVKTRIGGADECEYRLSSKAVDGRQCYIQFADGKWTLRTESHKHPTFVDGRPEAVKELSHRSKITFSDGAGFRFVNKTDLQADGRRRKNVFLAFGIVIGIAAAVTGLKLFLS